jgi:hypothetical protein
MMLDPDTTIWGRLGWRYNHVSYGTGNLFAHGWNIWGGYANGSVDQGGAAYPYANGSDARMKQDIAPSRHDCLKTLAEIPIVQYRWRELRNPWRLARAKVRDGTPLKRIGVIAQQIYEICPELVLEGDDYDDHLGRVWTLEANNYMALLSGAIQQLTKEVRSLKKKRMRKK